MTTNQTSAPLRVLSPEGSELMQVSSMSCTANSLTFKGKAFGAMPMAGSVPPRELRAAVRMLGLKGLFQLLLLLLRR